MFTVGVGVQGIATISAYVRFTKIVETLCRIDDFAIRCVQKSVSSIERTFTLVEKGMQ